MFEHISHSKVSPGAEQALWKLKRLGQLFFPLFLFNQSIIKDLFITGILLDWRSISYSQRAKNTFTKLIIISHKIKWVQYHKCIQNMMEAQRGIRAHHLLWTGTWRAWGSVWAGSQKFAEE